MHVDVRIRLVHDPVDVGLARDVGAVQDGGLTGLLESRLRAGEALLVAVAADHLRALAGESDGSGAADAAAGARDERHAPLMPCRVHVRAFRRVRADASPPRDVAAAGRHGPAAGRAAPPDAGAGGA